MPHRWQNAALMVAMCTASLTGHFYIAQQSTARVEQLLTETHEFQPQFSASSSDLESCERDRDFVALAPADVLRMVSEEGLNPHQLPRLLATLHYESVSEDPADALTPSPPPALPLKPLSKRELADQQAVRDVINEEMAESSAEERDIWFEELKSLPAEVVRDLLQVRQQMRILSPDHPLSGPAPLKPEPLEAAMPREIPVESVTQSRTQPANDFSISRKALQTAITWANHNLVNAGTPGFKRVEPLLADVYGPDLAGEESPEQALTIGLGVRWAGIRIDLTPGELTATNRSLDLAIDGEGFFVVIEAESSQPLFTRKGQFTFDSAHRLCLVADETEFVLQPPLAFPEKMVSFEIAADGTVSVKLADTEQPQVIGRIQLVTFADPTRLWPVGEGLLMPPPVMPPQPMQDGQAKLGEIRQGFLEASNVDLDAESLRRESWEAILRAMPVTYVPRTAGDSLPVPK